jgi:hypothetical protein
MGDLSDFLQDNWFELGSLIAQFGILAVIAWYARTKLRIPAASHRKVEPAETLSESLHEFTPPATVTAGYAGVGRMLSPMPTTPSRDTVPISARRAQRTSLWCTMIRWLRAPMTFGARVRSAA